MKKFWLVMLATLFCLSFCACGSDSDSDSKPITGEETLPATGITFNGAELTCVFDANVTTGYTWQYEIGNSSCLTVTVDEYLDQTTEEDELGVGGVQRYVFTAAEDGETTIHFWYSQSWDEEAEPAQEQTITVAVQDGQIVSVD